MKDVLFVRADGNGTIGLGHIMRSMTIAMPFRNAGFECVFISSPPIHHEIFRRYGFEAIESDYPYDKKTKEEAYAICEWMRQRLAGYVLVDSYYANNEYLSILKECAALICINSTRKKLNTDYLINENLACDRDYLDELYSGSGARLLLGAEYTPIRAEFCNRLYQASDTVRKVLITTGGSDPYNFMTDFLKRIKCRAKYDSLKWLFISGGCNAYYEDLAQEAEGMPGASVVKNEGHMADRMQECDLAISAGGTTALELSVIGVPTIGIAVADDQEAGLSFMHHVEIVRYAGRATNPDFWEMLFSHFDFLLANASVRKEMSEKSRQYIDGKGAERIFLQITKGQVLKNGNWKHTWVSS